MIAAPKIQTANDLTKALMLAVPERFPGCRIWRANTGAAVPLADVRKATDMLRAGNIQAAIGALSTARVLRFGIPGLPDLDGFAGPNGRRIGIEVKWGRDRQSDDQVICQQVYERAGCVYVLARELDEAIEELGRRL